MPKGKKGWSLSTSAMSIGVLSFSLAIARNDITWSILSVFYLILVWRILTIGVGPNERRKISSLSCLLVLWSSLPLLIGTSGFFKYWSGHLLLVEIAFVTLFSVFSVMIILILEKSTSFRSNSRFTNLFLYSFPVAAGAARAISRFISDQFFETEFFHGNSHLMLELIIVTSISFYIGFIFRFYFSRSKYKMLIGMKNEEGRSSLLDIDKEDFLDFLNSIFSRFERFTMISISTVFQWGIYGVIIYGLIVDNHPVTVWAVFSFGISVIPEIISRNSKNNFPAIIYFWSTLVLFIFAVGRPLGFYSLSRWWAEITHLLSGSAVALLLFSFLMYIDDRSENLSLPNWLIPLLVILFILPIGVFWEIAEFYVDLVFDSSVQPNLEDTGYDLIFNLIGAILSLLMISFFTTVDFFSYYRKNLLKILRSRS